jgi:hypothetical protein
MLECCWNGFHADVVETWIRYHQVVGWKAWNDVRAHEW